MELISHTIGEEALHVGSRPVWVARVLLTRAVGVLNRSYTRYELPRRPSVAHHHPLSVDLYVKCRTADTHLKY